MAVDEKTATELLETFSTMLRTARAMEQRLRRQFGPSSTAVALLKALCEGDARLGDLATRLCIAPSVVSRVVVPLEEEGLVRRHHDPQDARVHLLTLTAAGRSLLEDIRHEQAVVFTGLIADWPEDDVYDAIHACQRLDSAFAHAVPQLLPQPRFANTLEKITV